MLIVDDERPTRQGLINFFDWAKFNIKIVGEADDGENALRLVEHLQPNVILTDVKMPIMDGISFAGRVKKQYPDIKIIFISGYDDVDYIRNALKLEAVDYILKPVNLSELEAVIKRVLGIIGKEETQRTAIRDMEQKLLQSMPLLREKFYTSLIYGGMSDKEISRRLKFLQIDLKSDRGSYCVFVISIDDFGRIEEEMPEREWYLTSYAILNICNELIDGFFKGFIFEYERGTFVCVLDLDEDEYEEKILELASNIKNLLLHHLGISVTIGLGERVLRLSELHKSYEMARRAADYKFFLGKNRVISVDVLNDSSEEALTLNLHTMERLEELLKAADCQGVTSEINTLIDALKDKKYADKKMYNLICLQMLLTATRVLAALGVEDNPGTNTKVIEEILRMETIEDLKTYTSDFYIKACKIIENRRNSRQNRIVQDIKDIINRRFAENLTISDIAAEVYLTSTYLCLIFKQETGETINDYMTKVRVEKAKQMLMDKSLKFYDICYLVGYSDPSYFSKIFKKHTGFTPSEYRNISF